MSASLVATSGTKPKRIALLLADERLRRPGIELFLLSMNKIQSFFEYEILPTFGDSLISILSVGRTIDRNKEIRPLLKDFLERYRTLVKNRVTEYHVTSSVDFDYLVVISMVRFVDEYYAMREPGVSVLALGNWEKEMAPPSLPEFIQTLLVRKYVASVSRKLRGSVHLGTRGCLCDFTENLSEARLKVLSGFVCRSCRDALEEEGQSEVAEMLPTLLSRSWVGALDQPTSIASLLKKLKLDLFHTAGLEQTKTERAFQLLRDEGMKELIRAAGIVLATVLVFWLGFRSGR